MSEELLDEPNEVKVNRRKNYNQDNIEQRRMRPKYGSEKGSAGFSYEASSSSKRYAISLPIGYVSIGFTTLMYSLEICSALENSKEVTYFMKYFGGILLFIAGFLECLRKKAYNYIVLLSFSLFFWVSAYNNELSENERDTKAFGAIVLLWGILSLLFAITSYRRGVVYIIFFALNFLYLVVHAGGIWNDFEDKTELAAGIIGCIAAGVAVYIGFGMILNNTFEAIVFPLGLFEDESEDIKFD